MVARDKRLVGLVCAVFGVITPGHAYADTRGITVTWHAPAECPDESAVRAALAWMLVTHVQASETFTASAAVTATAEGYEVVIYTVSQGSEGERSLRAATCTELAEATVVVLALAIDPSIALPTEAPPAFVETPEPEVHDVFSNCPPIVARPRPEWAVSLGGVLDTNVIATPTLGLESEVAARIRHLRLSVRASVSPPRARTLEDRNAGGDVLLATLGLRACGLDTRSRFELGACGGVATGLVHARGFGVAEPRSARAPWLAFDLGLRTAVLINRRLALALTADVVVPVLRPIFFLEEIGDVYRPPHATLRLALAFEVRFP